jgi:hypothetical protein
MRWLQLLWLGNRKTREWWEAVDRGRHVKRSVYGCLQCRDQWSITIWAGSKAMGLTLGRLLGVVVGTAFAYDGAQLRECTDRRDSG